MSQPPEPFASASPPVPPGAGERDEDARLRAEALRAEVSATTDRARQARLATELAELEERAGDDAAAARDYLAAYNADPTFRESLEALIRLVEKRKNLKNLGRLAEAMVREATAPEERARALLMYAAYHSDVVGDWDEAQRLAREATEVEGAPAAEIAEAWLSLEIAAGHNGDAAAREEALFQRAKVAREPTWRALLLADVARLDTSAGELERAFERLDEAGAIESRATWAVARQRAWTAAPLTADGGPAAQAYAAALEGVATLIDKAITDPAFGDARGVPGWARDPLRLLHVWQRAAEARRAAGEIAQAASILDRAIAYAAGLDGGGHTAHAALAEARIALADASGDTGVAASIAEKRLLGLEDGPVAASLAMCVAEHAATQGARERAFDALTRALASDPACLPARALQLDMLSDGPDAATFAGQLEAFADQLANDPARGRTFLLAAYVWGAQAKDVPGARAALSQAALCGVPAAVVARLGRVLASVNGDAAWYEEATKRLLAAGAEGHESASLLVELIRSRMARSDAEGAARAVRDLSSAPRGEWLARALESFGPFRATGDRLASLDRLAALEHDPDVARGLALVGAVEAHTAGDASDAGRRARDLFERDPSDLIVVAMWADWQRAAGDHDGASRTAEATSATADDAELAAALRLEAGFERWRSGDREGAVRIFEEAATDAARAARLVLGWAGRGVGADSIDGRRRAMDRAHEGNAVDDAVLALERFSLEIAAGDPDAAGTALEGAEAASGARALAAALARLGWSQGAVDRARVDRALQCVGQASAEASRVAAVERARIAREAGELEEAARATRAWFEAGGGLPAAVEWLAAAMAMREPREEVYARRAVAASLDGEARESVLASAAVTEWVADAQGQVAVVPGDSPAARLTNLELAPAGCDPRRRAHALAGLGGALGDGSDTPARSLSGWSSLAASDFTTARANFEAAARAQPDDLSAWEGLRACGEASGDAGLRATAASELGARCASDSRAAAFWEEAALVWLERGDNAAADHALHQSFARDPRRPVAFDKLFRRVRARRANDELLGLIERRLNATDDSGEIIKLYWERARALRDRGDEDAALEALEHVRMLEADHVGALALLGDINVRRGRFAEAAESLARLASLDTAPARNRVTAGVAAVDVFEHKLERYDRALDVLLTLHRARLSTPPVRERLARVALRAEAWSEAARAFEQLMVERPEASGRIEAARSALAIHRDRLGDRAGAKAPVVKLLEESPGDAEALDLALDAEHPLAIGPELLEKARRTLVEGLQRNPVDVRAIQRLAKLAHRTSDDALERATDGILVALGAAPADGPSVAPSGTTPQIALGPERLRVLAVDGDSGPIADLFVLLGPTLAEALGPTLQTSGVSRRDKIDPRSGLPVRNEIAAWAGAFGVSEFDLYVGGSDPEGVQGIPGEPAALVVGPKVRAPLAARARARVVRELLAIKRGTTIVRLRDELSVAAVVVAACKLSEVPIQYPRYAVLAEIERLLGRAISRKTRKLIGAPCRAIASTGVDARAWARRTLATLDRAIAVAAGDASVALSEALRLPVEDLPRAVPGDVRAQELLRFVLSPDYLKLRRALGLEGEAKP